MSPQPASPHVPGTETAVPVRDHRVRLLHFTWRLSVAGGIPRFVRDLLNGLDPERFDVHLLTARPHYERDRLDELVSPAVTLHSCGIEDATSLRTKVQASLCLRHLVRRIRPDILHVHGGAGWLALPSGVGPLKVPVRVLQIHDPPQSRRLSPLNARVQRWMVRRFGFLPVVDAAPVREDVCQACSIDRDRVGLLPLGIDLEPLRTPGRPPAQTRTALGLPEGAPVVLYVARLVPSKNVALFLEVARRLTETTDACFVMAGDGPLRGELERQAATSDRSERVRFLGFQDDLVDLFHASDLFLSTSDYEGFGLAVLEAMAAGKPVVATAIGGVNDLIEEGVTGRLVAAGDVRGLVAATEALIQDPALRRTFGAAGRERAERLFSLPAMARRYERFYLDKIRSSEVATT